MAEVLINLLITMFWRREVGTFFLDYLIIPNLKRLLSIPNVGTLKFEDKLFISKLKLSLQGMMNTIDIEEEIN